MLLIAKGAWIVNQFPTSCMEEELKVKILLWVLILLFMIYIGVSTYQCELRLLQTKCNLTIVNYDR